MAAQAGCRFYKVAEGRYEAIRVPLNHVACGRLPRSVRGVTRVDAAGGVVVTSTKRLCVLLLLKGGEKRGRWVLPKGKRRLLEPRRRAARREVLEETGLARVDVGKFLLRESYFDKDGKNILFKQVSYYLMRCPKGKTRLKVSRAEGFTRGKWMSFEAALAATSPVRAHLTLRKTRIAVKNG
jgi:8-oxo-dGTP pyrophosphatase MutT (NUDIX family)